MTFGYKLYSEFAAAMDADNEGLPSEVDLRDALAHLAGNVGKNGNRREHGDEFLSLLSQAAGAGYLGSNSPETEEEMYRVYNPSVTTGDALAVYLPQAYPAVMKYAREYNVEDEYSILSKNDYLDEFRDVADTEGGHIAEANRNARIGGKQRKCLVIDIEHAYEKMGENFDITAFGVDLTAIGEDEEIVDGDDDDGDGDDDDGSGDADPFAGVTPLGEISGAFIDPETATNNIVELTAEAVFVDHPEAEGAPAATGLLGDETGAVEFVTFDEASGAGINQEETYHIKRAKVGDYDGELQISIQPFTEVNAIQQGAGTTEGTDPGENTTLNDNTAAAADGGEMQEADEEQNGGDMDSDSADDGVEGVPDDAKGSRPDAKRLAKWLRDAKKAKGRVWLIQTATEQLDDTGPDRAEQLIDYADSKWGFIQSVGDGKYRAD